MKKGRKAARPSPRFQDGLDLVDTTLADGNRLHAEGDRNDHTTESGDSSNRCGEIDGAEKGGNGVHDVPLGLGLDHADDLLGRGIC